MKNLLSIVNTLKSKNTQTLVSMAFLICLKTVVAAELSKTPTAEQLQAELQSIVTSDKRWRYRDLEEAGWQVVTSGSSQPWPHDYLVFKKANVYGVIVTQGKKTERISPYGVPYYNYKGGANTAYVLSGIPTGYYPVIGCNKIADWKDTDRRCKASKGEDCSLNTPRVEMVAFVKMPNKCSQDSTLLHSAYRYSDENPAQLESAPIKNMTCLVEEHRAKQCPVLMQ